MYLCVVDGQTRADAPGWDWGLAGNDWLLAALLAIPHHEREIAGEVDAILIRPSDFHTARAYTASLDRDRVNPDRWAELLDILESNPALWAYPSW